MWTRDGTLDNNGAFQPNHFVPLNTSSAQLDELPVMYANIVKHSKKHPSTTVEPPPSRPSTPLVQHPKTSKSSAARRDKDKRDRQTVEPPAASSPSTPSVQHPEKTKSSAARKDKRDKQTVEPPAASSPSTPSVQHPKTTKASTARKDKDKRDKQTVEPPAASSPSTPSVQHPETTKSSAARKEKDKRDTQTVEPPAASSPSTPSVQHPETTKSSAARKDKDKRDTQTVEPPAASSPSSSSLSVSMQHLIKPFLRYASKSDKNDDGFKENVLKRKREESETGESKRARKPLFGQCPDKGRKLYKRRTLKFALRGRSESKNRARLDSRAASIIETNDEGGIIGTNRSKVSVSLDENLKELKKVETTKRLEEKSRLLAVQAVGEHLHSTFPIISTQEAGRIYFNGTTALAYLDNKRDRDTIKFLLTKITSATFMAKLQGTSNNHSLQNCSLTLPGKLQKFGAIMLELTEKKNLAELLPNEKRGPIRRQRDLIKECELRHRFQSGQIAGRKLKIEEFPDISAILEYEFGEGDRVKRGGGGLESHPKLTNDILYRAADNMTNMIDARRALLALAPEDFSISLSSCYNYTQNFRKGTLEAKRHHEGRGINACISLHKAPDTAKIKDLVVDVHWSSANVNAILDEAAQNQCETFVDSYDAKQVARPSDRHNLKMWRRCEYEDHTYDQSRNNAITPMSHLFLETEETH
ncbi:hypothetical protein OS493_010594 [Desmophyllum pertusum]|uniref:Uncharacterized protein n=1 Tax=Desmophyllum pertusum TaxID=174260 RepID=A0A9X0D4H0_9CNID|nr:hypothetical protein OS493_010594 [Desmophyllum pertusum]